MSSASSRTSSVSVGATTGADVDGVVSGPRSPASPSGSTNAPSPIADAATTLVPAIWIAVRRFPRRRTSRAGRAGSTVDVGAQRVEPIAERVGPARTVGEPRVRHCWPPVAHSGHPSQTQDLVDGRITEELGERGSAPREPRLDRAFWHAELARHLGDREVDEVVQDDRAALRLGQLPAAPRSAPRSPVRARAPALAARAGAWPPRRSSPCASGWPRCARRPCAARPPGCRSGAPAPSAARPGRTPLGRIPARRRGCPSWRTSGDGADGSSRRRTRRSPVHPARSSGSCPQGGDVIGWEAGCRRTLSG